MFFDFRRGPDSFPSNCTIVDPMNAAAILVTTDILEKLKSKKKEGDESRTMGLDSSMMLSQAGIGNDDFDAGTSNEDHERHVREAAFE